MNNASCHESNGLNARQRAVRRHVDGRPLRRAVRLAAFAFFRFTHSSSAAEALWSGADRAATTAAFAAARTRAEESGVLLRLPRLDGAPGPGCTWPWDGAYVTSAGIVQPCCMVMGDDRVALGDLRTGTSFRDIWEGPAYQDFRARLSGDEPPEVCRGCALYQRTF